MLGFEMTEQVPKGCLHGEPQDCLRLEGMALQRTTGHLTPEHPLNELRLGGIRFDVVTPHAGDAFVVELVRTTPRLGGEMLNGVRSGITTISTTLETISLDDGLWNERASLGGLGLRVPTSDFRKDCGMASVGDAANPTVVDVSFVALHHPVIVDTTGKTGNLIKDPGLWANVGRHLLSFL